MFQDLFSRIPGNTRKLLRKKLTSMRYNSLIFICDCPLAFLNRSRSIFLDSFVDLDWTMKADSLAGVAILLKLGLYMGDFRVRGHTKTR